MTENITMSLTSVGYWVRWDLHLQPVSNIVHQGIRKSEDVLSLYVLLCS